MNCWRTPVASPWGKEVNVKTTVNLFVFSHLRRRRKRMTAEQQMQQRMVMTAARRLPSAQCFPSRGQSSSVQSRYCCSRRPRVRWSMGTA